MTWRVPARFGAQLLRTNVEVFQTKLCHEHQPWVLGCGEKVNVEGYGDRNEQSNEARGKRNVLPLGVKDLVHKKTSRRRLQ